MSRILFTVRKTFPAFLCLLLASACIRDEDTPPLLRADIEFQCTFDMQLDPYAPDGTPSKASDEDVRYIIDLYPSQNLTCRAARQIVQTPYPAEGRNSVRATFDLPPGRYRAAIWVDRGCNGTEYYHCDSLNAVRLRTAPYTACNESKEAFAGTADLDLTAPTLQTKGITNRYTVAVALERPMGHIEIISTDLDKFLQQNRSDARAGIDGYTIGVTYSCYFPCSYNTLTGKPNDAMSSLGFTATPETLTTTEARLAHDFVLVNGSESGVTVDLAVYGPDGRLANEIPGIAIPVRRGHATTVRGEFLTRDYRPGIGIDPGFDGDITITIPD